MKKLLLALIVLASVLSCGKNNAAPAGPSGLSSALSSSANAVSIANAINTNAFGANWAQALSSDPYLKFYYSSTTATSAQSQSNCQTKWTIFYVCTSGTTSIPTGSYQTVLAASQAVSTKQSQLMSIVNSQTNMYVSGTQVYIYTSDNKLYTLDTSMPIQANPVQIQDNTANTIIYYAGFSY